MASGSSRSFWPRSSTVRSQRKGTSGTRFQKVAFTTRKVILNAQAADSRPITPEWICNRITLQSMEIWSETYRSLRGGRYTSTRDFGRPAEG